MGLRDTLRIWHFCTRVILLTKELVACSRWTGSGGPGLNYGTSLQVHENFAGTSPHNQQDRQFIAMELTGSVLLLYQV